jgi:hypothetical protein
MRKGFLTIAVLLTAIAMTTGGWTEAVAEEWKGQIVGTKSCTMCHKSAKRGDQASVWEASAHAKAYETLASEQSLAIAQERGIGNPQEADECLKCHTTTGFLVGATVAEKNKFDIAEGVGCETCHGPGSEYKSNKVMKDPEAAAAAGLLSLGEEHCLKCHNEESPTYVPFDYEERWAQIAHPKAEG